LYAKIQYFAPGFAVRTLPTLGYSIDST